MDWSIDFGTCYIQHEVFDEVTHDSISNSDHNQGCHQEVDNGFGELDEVPGWRLVLLVQRLHIVNQELEWLSTFVSVIEAVHIPRVGASSKC